MKIHIGFATLAVVISSLITLMTCRTQARMNRVRDSSLAGQTLVDLSRAIERNRTPEGIYPDSIKGLAVDNSGGDFSEAVLRHVIYRRTEKGFVAFVGVHGVAYIEPDNSTHFDFVR